MALWHVFMAKLVWVPKTNHEEPKTKRVPNSIWDICFVGTNTRAMYLIYCGNSKNTLESIHGNNWSTHKTT